jgi:enediyne biosynthesis protein E5
MAAPAHGPIPLRRDPRLYQISALLLLLLYGWAGLKFDLSGAQAVVTITVTLGVQFACTRIWKLPVFDPRSALIAGLSLCLLLRTGSLWLVAATAAATIASKFLLRWNGKHLFNPTNFGLVFMMLCTGGAVWVSPGQWGSVAFFGFLMICLGGLVVHRAERADVTVAFLAFYLALLFGRSLWLGEPMSIPFHRLQNGALLLFAFFMISDPKTTPDSRAGRIMFALLVATGAAFVQFKLFRTNGLLWSLAVCALSVPLLDWLLAGCRYQWNHKPLTKFSEPEREKEIAYEPVLS